VPKWIQVLSAEEGDAVVTVPGIIEHFGWTNSTAALEKLFLEWFAFTMVDDAILSSVTSFSLTALTATAAWPSNVRPCCLFCSKFVAAISDCHSCA